MALLRSHGIAQLLGGQDARVYRDWTRIQGKSLNIYGYSRRLDRRSKPTPHA